MDQHAHQRLRIVLFEDNSNDVELIQYALEKTFDCLVTAVQRLDAYSLEISRQPPPDMIICDGCDVDGQVALTNARRQCPQVPFVFCSGNDAEAKKEAARLRGVKWVIKDAGFETLKTEVSRLTGALLKVGR